MEQFDRKYLLFCADSLEERFWSTLLYKAGLQTSDIEVRNVNITNKLQDKSYDACIIVASGVAPKLVYVMLQNMQSNRLASLVPVAVIDPGIPDDEVTAYYDNGANYVMFDRDRERGTKEMCHILENLLVLLDKYKMGQDKRFLR